MTTFQFEDPAPASSSPLPLQEVNGALLMIDCLAYEDHIPTVNTKPGEKSPAIRADVVVLDGRHADENFPNTLIFPKIFLRQLTRSIGKRVLGRLGQGTAKPGQSAPWLLNNPTEADKATAAQYLARHEPGLVEAEPPF